MKGYERVNLTFVENSITTFWVNGGARNADKYYTR